MKNPLKALRKNPEPIINTDFDNLAERMIVKNRLKKKNPYVFSKIWIGAETSGLSLLPSSIEFSKKFYDELSAEERLAVAAHEFAHIRERHGWVKFKRTRIPSFLFSLPISILVLVFPLVNIYERIGAMAGIFALSSIWWVIILSYIINFEYLETEADMLAAYFVGPLYLESALLKMQKLRHDNVAPLRVRLYALIMPRDHPAIEKRIQILRTIKTPASPTLGTPGCKGQGLR